MKILRNLQTKIRANTPQDRFVVGFAHCMLWSVPLAFNAVLFEHISHSHHNPAYLWIAVYAAMSIVMGILLWRIILRSQVIEERRLNLLASAPTSRFKLPQEFISVGLDVLLFLGSSLYFESMAIATAVNYLREQSQLGSTPHGNWLFAASVLANLWALAATAAFALALMKSFVDLRWLLDVLSSPATPVSPAAEKSK